MEDFAENLHVEKVREELSEILSNGRGVFRNYKNVLKKYPHIEKRFLAFKRTKMRSVVVEWYNALRESWGLEKLEQDFDDYDDLIQQDFEFSPYNPEKDWDCVRSEAKKIADELRENFGGETGKAVAHFWLNRFNSAYYAHSADNIVNSESNGLCGIVCHTLSGDFAACLLFERLTFAEGVVALTSVFANQNYRGLGIARELFSRGISYLKEHGVHSFIIADSAIPDFLEPLLARCGVQKKGSIYVLETAKF